jgi:hypothetical protein
MLHVTDVMNVAHVTDMTTVTLVANVTQYNTKQYNFNVT